MWSSTRVGVGIAVHRDGKVLLGKRKNAHGAGQWSFPGGHLDHGESIEACALRELEEETGLKGLSCRVGTWMSGVMDNGTHYITFVALVDEFEGELVNREPDKCEGWQWFSPDALPAPLFEPPHVFLNLGLAPFIANEGHRRFLTKLVAFYRERDWEKYHSPKNLVMDLVGEAAEIMEPFRWLTEEQSRNLDAKTLQAVQDEIGDTFILLLYLAYKLGLDPLQAAEQKLKKVGLKYPVDRCYGKAHKYTEYQ